MASLNFAHSFSSVAASFASAGGKLNPSAVSDAAVLPLRRLPFCHLAYCHVAGLTAAALRACIRQICVASRDGRPGAKDASYVKACDTSRGDSPLFRYSPAVLGQGNMWPPHCRLYAQLAMRRRRRRGLSAQSRRGSGVSSDHAWLVRAQHGHGPYRSSVRRAWYLFVVAEQMGHQTP